MTLLRIATRRSALAVAQTELVAASLRERLGVRTELLALSTRGDRTRGPLTRVGGKGLFTAELEAALRSGEVDLAVHSAKDMPAELTPDMRIVACPARGDARDALVGPAGLALDALGEGATVGTGSARRAVQLLDARGDLRIESIRGNVNTRLAKALDGALDAVVLAMAGLSRAGLADEHADRIVPLAIETMIPAAGQGVLAVQALADRRDLADRLAAIDHGPTRQAWSAERAVIRWLRADCSSPVGVHVWPGQADWSGRALVGRREGGALCVRVRVDRAGSAEAAGDELIARLDDLGAREILHPPPANRAD